MYGLWSSQRPPASLIGNGRKLRSTNTLFCSRGDALQYIRKRKEQVRPSQIVGWCRQIAEGMAYLAELKEGVKLVHRDLAARNVLVKNSNHVKIADFGLAQLVSPSENQIEEFGGKMPLKWLAVECIEKGIYCHKRFWLKILQNL